ncbi:MAG: phosphopantetheine-binding protein, partial [Verrucomicrobiota bacterium]
VSIGTPIANTQVFILDANHQPVPQGFTGELWIGGDGLARGYRNQPDLTAAAFQEIELPEIGKQRIYRTGDLARWNRDGKLECLGRVDFQVKVRGVRMELGDIETQMEAIDGIKQAVVTKREDLPSGEGLVGYYISEGATLDAAQIRSQLASHLPASYIPAYFAALDEFPLTPNKKIDRKQLPMPKVGAASVGERVKPRTDTEQQIWDIFSRNFDSEDIGVTDQFFEMGGDSLMALRIVVDVSEAFKREIAVDAFLTHPTIEQLAAYLEGDTPKADSAAETESANELGNIDIEDLAHIDVEEASDSLPELDAVALTYIPDVLAGISGMKRDEISERLFGGKPLLSNTYSLSEGKIGVIMLPCFEADLYKDPASVKAATLAALEMAGKAGARNVSLTGVIPTTTDHGRDIQSWMEGSTDLPAITTGDATRSATIVKSVEGILAEAGRDNTGETISVVGLGSIGFGTLRLMLDVMDHPKHLILCDPYQTDDQMSQIRDQVRDAGFMGQVDIVKNGGALPPEVYDASLVVASTNLPGVLNVKSLKSGTLVVDYSFPPVFRVDEAIQRFSAERDILFTTGGELKMTDVVAETIYLPEGVEEMSEAVQMSFIKFLSSRDKNEITGCVLVSLLTGLSDEVEPTLGPLENADALAHYEYLEELGVTPAKLQMTGFFLPEDGISAFREKRLGSSAAS